MFIEFVSFVVLLTIFATASWLRRSWLRMRDRRRDRWVVQVLQQMEGKPVVDAVTRFGSPFEVIEGTGRTFYVWKSPPSRNFPVGTGLLIVNVIADEAGQIAQSSWQTR